MSPPASLRSGFVLVCLRLLVPPCYFCLVVVKTSCRASYLLNPLTHRGHVPLSLDCSCRPYFIVKCVIKCLCCVAIVKSRTLNVCFALFFLFLFVYIFFDLARPPCFGLLPFVASELWLCHIGFSIRARDRQRNISVDWRFINGLLFYNEVC